MAGCPLRLFRQMVGWGLLVASGPWGRGASTSSCCSLPLEAPQPRAPLGPSPGMRWWPQAGKEVGGQEAPNLMLPVAWCSGPPAPEARLP